MNDKLTKIREKTSDILPFLALVLVTIILKTAKYSCVIRTL